MTQLIDLTPDSIVTVDFESYYDSDYSLTKMSTSEYIRDERYKTHMVGIKEGTKPAKWYPHDKAAAALGKIDWSKKALLCHNTAFDGFIMSHVYGIVPALYLDTYSMGRAAHGHHVRLSLAALSELHGIGGKSKEALEATSGMRDIPSDIMRKLGVYCINDVELCRELFDKLYPHIPDEEIRLIDITLRMFCDPHLELDLDLVNESLAEEVGGKVSALVLTGETPETLISDKKFTAVLLKAGLPVEELPIKISPATGKPTITFAKSDPGFKKLLNHPDETIRLLAEARLKLKSSIGETRARRFLEAGRDGMKLPVMLNYCGAHTTRWSGGNKMNLQNLKRGGKLRRSILAPPGYSVVVADSAQIEARVLAWLAGQKNISTAFANSEDVYKLMASEIYGIPIDQVDKNQRFLGKVCVLGLGYGMGPDKLQATLKAGALGGDPVDLPIAECKRIVTMYRAKSQAVTKLWKEMDSMLKRMIMGMTGTYKCITFGKGYVQLPNGLFLHYPGLRALPGDFEGSQEMSYMTARGFTKTYGGAMTENIVQALARVIIGQQMLAIADRGYRIVAMSHDEIVTIVPTEIADEAFKNMIYEMSTPPPWAKGLVLSAEGGHALNYSKE